MGDLVQLSNRCPPWVPTPQSVLVAQYRYYDIPLVGVIRQGDSEFLFVCLDGHDETLSLWWYASIDADQRKVLESADGEDFEQLLNTMEFGGWSRLALATINLGLVDFEDVEDTPDHDGMRVAMRALQLRVRQLSEDADRLEVAGR